MKLIKKKEGWYNLYDGEIGIGSTYEELQGNKLSLKNCQSIELGYDLDDLACNHAFNFYEKEDRFNGEQSFKEGFQKAIELMGDKKFSEEDMEKVIEFGRDTPKPKSKDDEYWEYKKQFIQSLQQTEWDVEIVMEPCFYDDSLGGFSTSYKEGMPTEKPKLDADGCLILKRI